jgi:hypothetical protein
MGVAEIIAITEAAVPFLAGFGLVISGRTLTHKIGLRIGRWMKTKLSDAWEDRFRATIKDLADGIVEGLG